ncbi:hypothetical protein [Virgibacillus chiguensis]|uniref:Uncharacterized protein n=1 Tax=Virgibacillus chiguensis TaxID=411959 RepID=A0A1M5MI80_9BACI|nr:hypothetical protein [Virgibacillus chiguensis]SHG76433.1 hypothetical protein SAMN05421807_101493 [Virgibacillus chiguensis]
MNKIAIKVEANNINKYLMTIKKHTGLSFSKLKSAIENKEVMAETDANDIDELEKLQQLIKKLKSDGAVVKIYDNDVFGEGASSYEEISMHEFENSIMRLKEILNELQDYDDNENEF